jgi:hypothetical protein
MKIAAILPLVFALALPLAAQEPQKPGPQHQLLTKSVGTWDAAMEMMDPTGAASHSKGVSEITTILGGFWVEDVFKASFDGQPFEGRGFTGYDPVKGKYVGTWMDSMSPHLMTLEGDFDKAGKVLTMSGMGMGMDGKPALHRMVTTHVDATKNTFEMFVTGPDGKEMKVMTITYTKRAAQPPK